MTPEASDQSSGEGSEPQDLTLTSDQITGSGLNDAKDGDEVTITATVSRDEEAGTLKLSGIEVETKEKPPEKSDEIEPSAAERLGVKPKKRNSMSPKESGMEMEGENE
jgi:hypothetical protein